MSEAAAPVRRLERPSNLRHEAYERIRRELLPGGTLSGVERLVERELADQLQMSRTPVRDALRRLALAGLVEPLHGGGYVRRQVTLREIDEHYELLEVLEPMAVEMAARAEGPSLATLLSSREVVSRDVSPMANTSFHVAIAEASGNQILARVIATLNERLTTGQELFAGVDTDLDRQLAEGHDQIVVALQHRDPSAAGDAMRKHLGVARSALSRRARSARADG